ncbi:GNAT family N-acetyltransferase [Gracilibacillus marinus]|jgi:predicted N-acetyltransferase YhbS|uniref:GNAT family N-acetyltransferase n=1 Tax=Gracilibacillus marinus TaxID=630535 RepID=A0ABV8VTZ4_9BACI
MEIIIRQEQGLDYQATEAVVKEAFRHVEQSDKTEHLLVNKIRKTDAFIPELSLVACLPDQTIIGHIMLSEIKIKYQSEETVSLALAPVSVLPAYQRKGVGSQLIYKAIKKAEQLGYLSIIVLGHEDYYPRFGFREAALWQIQPPFDVPQEAFMVLELREGALEKVQGVVEYSEAFS